MGRLTKPAEASIPEFTKDNLPALSADSHVLEFQVSSEKAVTAGLDGK